MKHALAFMKNTFLRGVSRGLYAPAFSVLCFLWTGFISPISVGDVSAGDSAGSVFAVTASSSAEVSAFLANHSLDAHSASVSESLSESASSHDSENTGSPLDELTEIPRAAQPQIKVLTETQQDTLDSEYLFTQARILQASGKLPEALRKYQRAYRYSRQAETILGNVVYLAAELERPQELLTYFRKMKNLKKMDVLALRDVGIQLTTQDAWPEAAEAFQAAMDSPTVRGNPAAMVFLRMDMGRALYVLGRYEEAANGFRYVFCAMQHPERYDLDEAMSGMLMLDAAFYYSLMADANLLSGNLEQAETLLEKSVQAQHEDLHRSGVPRRQQETQRKVITITADFTRAKIAFMRKNYPEAKTLLELVLNDLKPEAHLGEAPYKWYADTLAALDETDKIIPAMTKYYERAPEDSVLGFFLAKKWMEEVRREKDPQKLQNAQRQAEFILKKHTRKHAVTARLADLLEIAIRRADVEHFWETLEYVFAQVNSREDMILILRIARRQVTEPVSAANTDTDVDTDAESAAENETVASAADVPDAEDETVTHLEETPGKSEETQPLPKVEKASSPPAVVESWKHVPALSPLLEKAMAAGKKRAQASAARHPWRTYWLLGILEKLLENPAQAEAYYKSAEDALRRQPTKDAVPFFVDRGFGLLAEDAYEKAVDVFRAALPHATEKPDRQRILYFLSSAMMLDLQYPQALEQINILLGEDPKNLSAQIQRALILSSEGRTADAAREYAQFIHANEADYENQAAREFLREARSNLSVLKCLEGDKAVAAELLEEVLDEFPDDVGAKNDLAYLWAQSGTHLRRALRMAETCVAHSPENAAYHDTLGWVHFQMKHYEKAETHLRKAEGISPDPVIMSHLGDLNLARKNMEQAERYWREAQRLFAEFHKDGKVVATEDEAHVNRRMAEYFP